MDVFSAFPNAIVSNVWQLGQIVNNTETGRAFDSLGFKDVIVDEEALGSIYSSPSAAEIDSGTLIYAKPSQLPTVNTSALVADYFWYDSDGDQYYSIVEVGLGKNQENGRIEHIEFKIRQTEVING